MLNGLRRRACWASAWCAHKASSTWRQRAVFAVVVALGGSAEAKADVPVGLNVGYAFRSLAVEGDGAADDRAHGVAASVVVDSPPLLWGFGLRGEGLALAWPGTPAVDRSLGVFGAGGALTYSFDETAVKALASFGLTGVAVVDGDVVTPTLAPTMGLLLRFPLTEAAAVDARVLVPFVVDDHFGLAAAAMIGLSISPDVVVAAALDGRSPLSLIVPALD